MNHLSDRDIQQYALDKTSISKTAVEHIDACAHCRQLVENYQLLFLEIGSQAKPAFDFDLSSLIINQLPVKNKGLSTDRFIAGFLILFFIACVGFPIFLFGQYILNIFSGIPTFFIYATLISTSIIIGTKLWSMYRKHHQQMKFLNYS